MAIDPNKLQAFANQPPGGGKPKGDKGGPPGKGGKDQPPKPKPEGEGGDAGGEGDFKDLIPLLEASAEDLEANCDELDHDMLLDPESEITDEDKQILEESFHMLPKELQAKMVEKLDGIEKDDAHKLAEGLEAGDMISDVERTTGYFERLGALIASGDLKAGEGDDEEEGDEPEAKDDEDEEPEGNDAEEGD